VSTVAAQDSFGILLLLTQQLVAGSCLECCERLITWKGDAYQTVRSFSGLKQQLKQFGSQHGVAADV
jgi:hypothetical protein